MSGLLKINHIVYGAVHDTHDFRYIGFCKKVQSDEVQSVDVWLDGEKVETLRCDKTIDKIVTIYNKAGFAFEYSLPEQYMGKKHLVNFTCSNAYELENSPIRITAKDDDGFNECRFMHSLGETIDEEKIKDMYCPNVIGFLATEENIADEEFMGYIKKLMEKFPEVEFKGFYFTKDDLKIAKNYFHTSLKSINLICLNNIYEIFNNITIFLLTGKRNEMLIRSKISSFIPYIYLDLKLTCSIEEYENNNKAYYDLFLTNYQKFDITEEDFLNFGHSFFCIILNKFIEIPNSYIFKDDLYTSLYEKRINLLIKNIKFYKYFLDTTKKLNLLYDGLK